MTNLRPKTKFLLLSLCALLLIAATVCATMAYLTATTKTVTNTFTVGKVGITLDEAIVDVYGRAADPTQRTDKGNTYKLIPGHSYTKDPVITVAADSEDCWLYAKIENPIDSIEAESSTIASQLSTNGWTLIDEAKHIYAYKESVKANAKIPLFGTFTLDGSKAVDDFEGKSITVTAYAIQADGFETAKEAYNSAFPAA